MVRINLIQLCGAIGFAYFCGILIAQMYPITENIQIMGVGCFAILSLLGFAYGTFALGRVSE